MMKLIKGLSKAVQANFADFYKGTELKREADFRRASTSSAVREYLEKNGIDPTLNYNTEAGKMHFVKDQHTERIQISYKYLSQFQHFSGRAYNFYKNPDYVPFNPVLSLMLLFLSTIVIHDISAHLTPGVPQLELLVKLAAELAG
ncbi:hypothetical protein [Parachryseolinea silvisoli]|uniref:hypothetical protein n=1 Tax=Parachryseolinea silvisoli TaxID=2873601 RepID=UPI002265F0C0|nr:hypothetical protein [Parachryseolinea silvisoli]MCD9015202.1 hypothetical protein [Parachryseolinea silvisoli]